MLAILYIFLIIVFLIIVKQFYFSDAEYFHPIELNSNSKSPEHSHTIAASRSQNQSQSQRQARRSFGSPADEPTEETTSASIDETTSASQQQNETSSAVETTSPSDTIQASVNDQPQETEETQQSSESVQTEQSQETDSDRVVSDRELLQILFERLREERENRTEPVITARADSECCGLNIYNNELQNINKCLVQHLQEQTQTGYKMIVDRWKSVDDRSCKNPPHILAKTTNCSGNNSVTSKYFPHLTTLHNIASNSNSKECAYSAAMAYVESQEDRDHRNQPTSLPINDFQQLSLFLRNINCDLVGKGNNLAKRPITINGARFEILGCSGNSQ